MKPDPESQQMSKQNRADDLAKSMTRGVKPKKPMKVSSNIGVRKQKVAKRAPISTGGRTSSNIGGRAPLNIPMADMSPEFKRLVVDGLIRTGKARVVRRRDKQTIAKEQQQKEKEKK